MIGYTSPCRLLSLAQVDQLKAGEARTSLETLARHSSGLFVLVVPEAEAWLGRLQEALGRERVLVELFISGSPLLGPLLIAFLKEGSG